MSIRNRKNCVSMAILLWGIMMVLVLVTVAFMWVFQIHFMERNYIESNISEVQTQVEAVLDDLKTEDLAYNEQLFSSLSQAADGKLLIVNSSGQMTDLYTYGHPIDLAEDRSDVQVWERIANGPDYPSIRAGEPIPEEDRAIIWERYQRSQHQAGRRQGTGIGSSIIKTILDAHGMTCGVDCRDGLTCFWFRYPTEHL